MIVKIRREMLSVPLKREYNFRVSENRMLKRVFGPRTEEITEGRENIA
jgi:hypothetical protein